jgi:hypothetical protein
MSYNWIKAEDYTMDTLLLFDRWVIRYLMEENEWYNNEKRDYKTDMGKALSRYPHVAQFCKHKAPEASAFIDKVLSLVPKGLTDEEARKAEISILDYHDTFVVYAYPEVMNQVGSPGLGLPAFRQPGEGRACIRQGGGHAGNGLHC